MILHLAPLDDWLRDPGRPYSAASLLTDGFLHCSPDEAVTLAVANHFFPNAPDPLMALLIEEEAVEPMVRWEAPNGAPPPGVGPEVLFPHIYGRLNRSAVAGLLILERGPDGHWAGFKPWS
ncbi:uncharacterized protein (DUF952 family) [Kitasatospora sp. MAP12-15]|uniref:DUF952 domain-containing protein n=1 Tax=unclassified Kitasatospora TaxID=2633591 RepID=UPI002474773E|nr:DUF952 domain-containing protein [Kitasatospora sp. MAP12-44]MDH6113552.1 uncharacterized protein (DUF952 family) [Kitasatospora sp. MAP12-44]